MDAGEPQRVPQEDDRLPEQRRWSRRAQAVAAVVWPSFLAAALATMLFFAFVDPGEMEEAMTHPLEFNRMTGYGVGFFFFWLIALVSSAVSVYLLRTAHRNSRSNGDRD
ncbi:MAG: hypothetical protein D6727_07765 [Gammaproteobacteria bacterium]|nr:MAG: hypothetical protein D6727_07765 [Gammaproteobacteria bacterium]